MLQIKTENKNNYDLINKLYMDWLNEKDPFVQRKKKDYIKSNVSRYDLLMYSIRFALPFEAFRNIFTLSDLFETLEEIERRGVDITGATSQTLLIQGIEDIQCLNKFSQRETITKVGNFRLRFEGSSLFEYGDVKNIGERFPYACVNFIDIESVEQMIKNEKNYKGVPIIITIDNMGQLPLDKLSVIEAKFDVAGVRIIEKDRDRKIEQRPINLTDYKRIRTVIDNDIINKLYVTEQTNKTAVDLQLATQILSLIANKVKYDTEFKGKSKQISPEEWFSYYSNVSNISGLVTGNTICGGYAEIIRNVLSCVGIKSKTMVGKTANDGFHAWNQIEIGNTWFNTDLTLAAEQIRKGKPSGDLFMSDKAFFGDRRNMVFNNQGKSKNGESMEIEVIVGGHSSVFNTNSKKCDFFLPPYVTTTLMKIATEYEEQYKRYGKSLDYKGAIPYAGSKIQKLRFNTKTYGAPGNFEH